MDRIVLALIGGDQRFSLFRCQREIGRVAGDARETARETAREAARQGQAFTPLQREQFHVQPRRGVQDLIRLRAGDPSAFPYSRPLRTPLLQ
jgi:hypothetical protein